MESGDLIEVTTPEKKYKGYLMPQRGETTVIKLKSGYNIGIHNSNIEDIKKIGGGKQPGKIPEVEIRNRENLPKVTFLSTGGTIGTHVDYLTGAVYMCRTPEQILSTVPEMADIVNLRLKSPFTKASEDMTYRNWQELAEMTAEELNSGAEGVIITHGTDYLHFTGTALSFMLKNLGKPVAMVGAQRSPDRGSFDGNMNLLCAAHYATSGIGEVCLVMHGTSDDSYCLANRAVKCRKMHTSRRDAFRPINDLPVAKIWPDGKIENNYQGKPSRGEVVADTSFEPKVALVKSYIGSDPSIIDWYVDKGYRGIVIEGSALGHLPTGKSGKDVRGFDGKLSWIPHIKRAVEEGMVLFMTSTCLYGRTNPYVYRNLRLAQQAGVIYGKELPCDMLPEVAYIKLGWVLGHTDDPEVAKEMMLRNYCGEIGEKSDPKTFLY